jgi:hypothetical protein
VYSVHARPPPHPPHAHAYASSLQPVLRDEHQARPACVDQLRAIGHNAVSVMCVRMNANDASQHNARTHINTRHVIVNIAVGLLVLVCIVHVGVVGIRIGVVCVRIGVAVL